MSVELVEKSLIRNKDKNTVQLPKGYEESLISESAAGPVVFWFLRILESYERVIDGVKEGYKTYAEEQINEAHIKSPRRNRWNLFSRKPEIRFVPDQP